jgi:5-methylcytosine-specific restriction endonuclease McrBC GTP-binding regulatory subunit McrB
MMLRLAVLNRLILFIRFYFTILRSEPFLQLAGGRMRSLLPLVSGSNCLGDGRS